ATGMQWVVALPHALLVEPGVAKFIAEWFLDYHTLPFDHSRVDIALGRACGMAHLRTRHMGSGPRAEQFVFGNSEPARHLQRLIARIAPTDTPVLIRGESGSGKELIAQALHSQSLRRTGPFIAVHCGAIPEQRFHPELLGPEQGAHTSAHQSMTGPIYAA